MIAKLSKPFLFIFLVVKLIISFFIKFFVVVLGEQEIDDVPYPVDKK